MVTNKIIIDHDPITKDFRGYLCDDCNLGLGKLGDDVGISDRVARYFSYNGSFFGEIPTYNSPKNKSNFQSPLEKYEED